MEYFALKNVNSCWNTKNSIILIISEELIIINFIIQQKMCEMFVYLFKIFSGQIFIFI
jgi:hypothetical protein